MKDETIVKQTDADKIACYEVLKNSYDQKYKLHVWFLRTGLKHMLQKLREETTLYIVMQEILKNRECNKE